MFVNSITLIVVCLKVTMVIAAPLLQFLQPYQRIAMEPSQQILQQQLMELQTMQQVNPMLPFGLNSLQPILILLPDQPANANINTNKQLDEPIEDEFNVSNDNKINTKDGDEDSVVIDAEPMPILEEQKAFLIIPNGRLSIGSLISAIPFLPIEINVPDTIAWAYNGIASGIGGIITIIGSRLPFQRPTEVVSMKNVNLKSAINEIQMKNINNIRPILVMPLSGLSRPLAPYLL